MNIYIFLDVWLDSWLLAHMDSGLWLTHECVELLARKCYLYY